MRGCVFFKGQDRVANTFGLIAGKNESGRGQKLAGHAVRAEGALTGAAIDADMTEEGAAVAQIETDATRKEGGEGGIRVDRAGDAGGEVEDGRVLERVGHQVPEPETALHEAGGNDERGTELGLVFVGGADFVFVRFGDDGHCLARQKGLGADNISAVDLIVQPDGRIGAAMDEVADRIGLDGALREFPDTPQSGEFGREVDRRRRVLEVGIEEAELAS